MQRAGSRKGLRFYKLVFKKENIFWRDCQIKVWALGEILQSRQFLKFTRPWTRLNLFVGYGENSCVEPLLSDEKRWISFILRRPPSSILLIGSSPEEMFCFIRDARKRTHAKRLLTPRSNHWNFTIAMPLTACTAIRIGYTLCRGCTLFPTRYTWVESCITRIRTHFRHTSIHPRDIP